jgi:large subunit ribosomal protein L21
MYAIVETGGKQYRVKPGDTIAVERVPGEPGEVLDLGRVLLVAGDGDAARVGSPGVAGAVVRAEVVEHARGEKVVVFRYKSKVRYRRKTGHRQALTRLRITDILLDGHSTAAERPAAEAPEVAREDTAATTSPRASRTTSAATPAEAETPAADTELPSSAGEAGPPPEADESQQTEAR